MKKYIIYFLIPFTIFISFNGYGQEIDSSIIQNLTSDQIAIAEDVINSNELKPQMMKIHLIRNKPD